MVQDMDEYRNNIIKSNAEVMPALETNMRGYVTDTMNLFNISQEHSDDAYWLTNIAITKDGLLEDEELIKYVKKDSIDSKSFIHEFNEALNELEIEGVRLHLAGAIVMQEDYLYPVTSDNIFGLYGYVDKKLYDEVKTQELISLVIDAYDCIDQFNLTEIRDKVPQDGMINISEDDVMNRDLWAIATSNNEKYMTTHSINSIVTLSNLPNVLESMFSSSPFGR